MNQTAGDATLRRLADDDAVGQLVRRDGRMRELGSEGGKVKLDWVDELERLLDDPPALARVEDEARSLGEFDRVIWAGMGGSANAVHVLGESCADDRVHVLDSTDPTAVGAALRGVAPQRATLVAVSMGITSEEPLTHLEWFARVAPGQPSRVYTVEGSLLERRARELGQSAAGVHAGSRRGFPGRMSAPSTLVFLLPAALHLGRRGALRDLLHDAWARHDLRGAAKHPLEHRAVRRAAWLVAAGTRVVLSGLPPALHRWVEQLLEQSLGKNGKGLVVLEPQPGFDVPELRCEPPAPGDLAGLAAYMLDWQLTTALVGYAHGTNIVDEPAVESYKAKARALRGESDPLAAARGSSVDEPWIAASVAGALAGLRDEAYVDVTINGESTIAETSQRLRELAPRAFGRPVKVRRAPAAYHVSEQSEMDGPPDLLSIRFVAEERCAVEGYDDRFLRAQAVASWQAMNEQGRRCFLVRVARRADLDWHTGVLPRFFAEVRQRREAPC